MPTALITGASRGLGLGLAEAFAADGWRIFACARAPQKAAALQALAAGSGGRVTLHALDVEDHASIERLGTELRGTPIDLLLNVAGFYGSAIIGQPKGMGKFGESDFAEWERIYRTNVIGPMKMAETFVDNVAASTQKKIVTLSSILGSMESNKMGAIYGYRASKAAVNAVMKSMSLDLKARGITAIPLHPGWVRTEMGGPNADIDPQQSVRGMKQVIDTLTIAASGTFLAYDGRVLPW